MLVPFKEPPTDYLTGCEDFKIYIAGTDDGWILFSELVLNHCFWN
jgi:hypothetical protein